MSVFYKKFCYTKGTKMAVLMLELGNCDIDFFNFPHRQVQNFKILKFQTSPKETEIVKLESTWHMTYCLSYYFIRQPLLLIEKDGRYQLCLKAGAGLFPIICTTFPIVYHLAKQQDKDTGLSGTNTPAEWACS
jgi:hypothetical protein